MLKGLALLSEVGVGMDDGCVAMVSILAATSEARADRTHELWIFWSCWIDFVSSREKSVLTRSMMNSAGLVYNGS